VLASSHLDRAVSGCLLAGVVACGGVDAPGALGPASGHDATAGTARSSAQTQQDNFFAGAAPPASAQQQDCRKIDFLFVIDNSFSMEREQASLTRSFPRFMSVIARELQAADFHVMVVDTDAMGPGEAVAAEKHAPSTPDEICDVTLGAGRHSTRGGTDCELASGARFIGADQPALASAFECIGQVGTAGSSYEQPVGALLEATSSGLAGACNTSFLRDDAVLVVTLVTDEDDSVTYGQPADWRDSLLRAKHGDESALVLLGLVTDQNRAEALAGGPCATLDSAGAPRLQSFIESFRFGSLGAVCATDYAPFFERAVSVIGDACHEFVPPDIR
jgi:hypothetical protein